LNIRNDRDSQTGRNSRCDPMSDKNDAPRPFRCSACSKTFRRLEHLSRHTLTHTGQRPHSCRVQGCSKAFARADDLLRHHKLHNSPTSRLRAKVSQQQQLRPITTDEEPIWSIGPVIRSGSLWVVAMSIPLPTSLSHLPVDLTLAAQS